jgi:tight adherence protein B
MQLDGPQLLVLIQAAAVFGLLFVLWMVGMVIWSIRHGQREKALEHRLRLDDHEAGPERILTLWHDDDVATVSVRGKSAKPPFMERLRARHKHAGIAADPGQSLAIVAGSSGALAFVTFVLTTSFLLPLAAAAIPPFVYVSILSARTKHRNALFEKQLVHALDLASRSLRAGHPLLGAFHLIAEELDPPVSTVFAEVCQQQAMGVGLDDGIQRAANNTESEDLRLFSTCLAIQMRSGGNLADMMDRLAFVMRERMRLGRRIRVLSSQAQLSKRVLAGLPVVLFGLMSVVNPSYAATLYTTEQGKVLLAIAAGALLLGMFVMNKMAAIKY